nr:hypothetical protein [Tanacetum cinerariifolium]
LPSQDAIEFIGIMSEMMHCSQLLSKAYQEYYACAMGEAAPKPKASARKKKELSWKSSEDEEVGSQEEGNESNDDRDDESDKDSEETFKSGAGKDGHDDDDEDDHNDDKEEETAKADEELKETGEAQIPPPTIPSIIIENLPTFNSAFRFEERL